MSIFNIVVDGQSVKNYQSLSLFLPGDGNHYYAHVAYWSEFPRDKDSLCAFCHGNPVPDPEGIPIKDLTCIEIYYLNKSGMFETCPVCLGKPS